MHLQFEILLYLEVDLRTTSSCFWTIYISLTAMDSVFFYNCDKWDERE